MSESGAAKRSYDNSGRRAEVAQQKRAVVEAFVEQLRDPSVAELSVRDAAAKVGVSERTVHRYFPDEAARMQALAEWIEEYYGDIDASLGSVDDLPAFVRAGFRRGQKDQHLLRLLYRSGYGNEVRTRYLAGRRARYAELLQSIGAPAAATRRATNAVSHLASAESTIPLVDAHGLSPTEAEEVVVQAIEAIIRDLRSRAS